MRGKKHEWQGVVLLPFIPVSQVAEASAPLALSAHERLRDARTEPLAFAHPDSPLSLAVRRAGGPLTPSEGREGGSKGECVLPWAAAGLAGSLLRTPVELSAPLAPLPPLRPRRCECFAFLEPPLLPHRCALLAAATIVPPRLSITDHKVTSYLSLSWTLTQS